MVDIHSSRKDFIKFKIDILKASISSLEFHMKLESMAAGVVLVICRII